ncbi:MAG TPA: YkgJ family cysteine cluster protein [Syntrophales bacterium]|nr:YkgJ family cysteine cluster protein [Syntrophales bacterium]
MIDKLWKYFECQRCGKCCLELGLPYDQESLSNISTYLNISEEQVIEKYYGELSADSSEWESNDSKRIPCPFLKSTCEGYYCEIYPARPEGCRVYPMESVGARFCPRWEIAISKLKKEQEEEI